MSAPTQQDTGRRRLTRLLAWTPLVVTVAAAGGLVAFAAGGSARASEPLGLAVPSLAFGAVGGVVASRRPQNAQGWVLAFFGASLMVQQFMLVYGERAAAGDTLPAGDVAVWLSSWLWAVGIAVLWTGMQLFPNGRPVSPRWRWGLHLGGGAAALTLGAALLAWGQREQLELSGTFGYSGAASALSGIALVLTFATVPVAVAALTTRFRRGGRTERLQLKWLLSALFPLAAGSVVFLFTGSPEGGEAHPLGLLLSFAGMIGVPLAMGVAVLRYRLYEIDRIVSRTVSWAVLTGVLAALYLGSVVVLQRLLAPLTGESDLAVAGATLAVAALFTPVRRGIQGVVDRRFKRARYDAERTVAAFRLRLRDDIDLHALQEDLIGAVTATVQPERASLWLRSDDLRGGRR